MTRTNKQHAKISRADLMKGIAAMRQTKPKEKEELTQKEAVEIAAEVVRELLAKGFSMAEIIEMMKANFGLTLDPATVRSYLRQVKAANDAAAEQKQIARRDREAKSATPAKDAGKIDTASSADRKVDDRATGAIEESDSQQNDDGEDKVRQNGATDTVTNAQTDAVSDDSEDELQEVEALFGQLSVDADHDMEGHV